MLNAYSDVSGAASQEVATASRHDRRGASILIIDHDTAVGGDMLKTLTGRYALAETASSIEAAEALRKRCHFDLFVVNLTLTGSDGVEWLRSLRDGGAASDVIFMADYADLDTAIAALRAGAADLLIRPFGVEQMLASIRRCLERRQMSRENFLTCRRAPEHRGAPGILGESEAIQGIHDLIQRVAPTSSTLLVEGETGTGKELVARAVHKASGRKGPFVAVNCGAISRDLLESELFGHTKGAFTGAHGARDGLFLYASDGTLFLDEIGEMPLALQANLLRVLEEKLIRPVGADRELPVNCRVIAATNASLAEQVESGGFREDLYYRLSVLNVVVPPLRERAGDIPLLANHFSQTLSAELGMAPVPFTHGDFVHMQRYSWPGNVRELRNVVERSLLLGKLPSDCWMTDGRPALGGQADPAPGFPLDWPLVEVEKQHILCVLQAASGNKSEAARRLGISRKTLDRKLSAWNSGTDEQ